ncbi:hypothetical protein KCV07_g1129, partial [Aureobasidium melanogenum]
MLSFPDASTLDLIIPNSSDFDVGSHLKSDNQLISRDALFFEELLPVYVILRSSLPSFQEVVKSVELYITAYATQPSPPPRLQSGGAPAPPQQPVKLALDSVTITPEQKPTLAIKVHITPEQVSDVLLCLDLESARHGGVQIDEIKAEGSSLTVEPFSADLAALSLPTTLQTGDKSTFLYKLARPKDTAGVPSHHSRPSSVTFQIRAVAQVSDTCSAQIQARWHGNVNFPPLQPAKSMPLRPQSVASTTQDRPLSKRVSTMTTRPMSGMTQVDSAGVTFAFTAPDKVKEGETFLLDVFVVNRSTRRKRLAIVAIPKSVKSAQSQHTLRFPNISRQDSHHTAEAVMDDRTIYHMQDQREARISEVVCLNADVRVGPLPPGACHNVQLEFLTLSSGLVGLAAVHVVDLDSRETTQITELPDIMVSK